MASIKRSALAPGCVVDLTVLSTEIFINYRSFEHQAASDKLQAPSSGGFLEKLRSSSSSRRQASSPEQQASSDKPQAASCKMLDPS